MLTDIEQNSGIAQISRFGLNRIYNQAAKKYEPQTIAAGMSFKEKCIELTQKKPLANIE
jgi:hypothetical protein